MPYDDPDPTDPMTLHGVGVETDDDSAMVEMTACFIEEYARLGFDAHRILHMFRTQGYAGPALAMRTLGPERIRALIAQEMARRGEPDCPADASPTNSADISLPVLNTGG